MILPVGATIAQSDVVDACCQNDARLIGGGAQDTEAGVLTDTEVSEYSRLGELAEPVQSTEQVTALPCADGGDQMSIRLILTDANIDTTVVLVTVQIVPAAHRREVGVRAVDVPLVDVNR